jgi:hypothetical protein
MSPAHILRYAQLGVTLQKCRWLLGLPLRV